jgi:hypothetical protein
MIFGTDLTVGVFFMKTHCVLCEVKNEVFCHITEMITGLQI